LIRIFIYNRLNMLV